MGKLEELTDQVMELMVRYMHSAAACTAEDEFEKLLHGCQADFGRILNPQTVDTFKHFARLHGLPPAFSRELLEQFRDVHLDDIYRLKLAFIIKYCVLQNPNFVPFMTCSKWSSSVGLRNR